ncbi:MAG: VCBS repeat-containing protein [Bacteroidota bacterium]
MNFFKYLFFLAAVLFFGCNNQEEGNREMETGLTQTDVELFRLIPSNESGVQFVNTINETPQLNYYTYKHMYIGAGVATGDFNNDGLPDIYFTGNLSPNKLYLNKGDFKFEDITASAGVAGNTGFYMGVTLVDINQDGWLDIYLCKSGKYRDPKLRENLLFINNGDLTFTEKGSEYRLNDSYQSVQSSFFDYDRDGDLDMFLVNTPVNFSISQRAFVLEYIYSNPQFRKLGGNDKLYRNDNGNFVDVTEQAGILPDLGFGLSVSTTDFNDDGWPDIFVANDFIAPDYLYINNKDGTFSEQSKDYLRHTSFYSMGSDASDINNDGKLDLMVTDMNPADYVRSKTTMEMMNRELFANVVDAGYNNIYMHNMLHMNTGMGSFSEVANLAGIANTDWSWSVLGADFDNDGWKDIHITNGVFRDVLDRDRRNAINEFSNGPNTKMSPEQLLNYLKSFPSQKLPNYMFQGSNGYKFIDRANDWGMGQEGFSNGVAIADLDRDGDLDMVVNNLMDTAYIYKNQAELNGHNFFRVQLKGSKGNRNAIGSKIFIETDDGVQMQQVARTRGYLSGSEAIAHFGLGKVGKINKLRILWPDGKETLDENIKANQLVSYEYSEAEAKSGEKPKQTIFKKAQHLVKQPYQHKENEFDDYTKQVLLPYNYSRLGPFISVGDINGDGLDDFHIGGAHGQPGAVYVQSGNGEFDRLEQPLMDLDNSYEDLGSEFFDADNDGDLDLYVTSGGYEFDIGDALLQDRLYLNNGVGVFDKAAELPKMLTATSTVKSVDVDKDGDYDLFVGGRLMPGAYPYTPKSYLLINQGGSFEDKTREVSNDLAEIGMVTSAVWHDINSDGFEDLILAGEWMSVSIFLNENGKLVNESESFGLSNTEGWWQKIGLMEHKDGYSLVAGNLGLNIKHKASIDKPFHVYASDFDQNNSVDIILAKYYQDKQVPVRGRDCTSEQMPFIAEKFETFDAFASSDIQNMFGDDLETASHFEAKTFASQVIDLANGRAISLPDQAQFSSVNGILVHDVNSDELPDLIIAGNLFMTEVETTRMDAGTGLVLINKGDENFEVLDPITSGFYLPEDVKDLKMISRTADGNPVVLAATNNGTLKVFQISKI